MKYIPIKSCEKCPYCSNITTNIKKEVIYLCEYDDIKIIPYEYTRLFIFTKPIFPEWCKLITINNLKQQNND